MVTDIKGDILMKKGFHCPECGTLGLRNLLITTHKGNSLSLLMASQADIRKSSGEAFCVECKQFKQIECLRNHRLEAI